MLIRDTDISTGIWIPGPQTFSTVRWIHSPWPYPSLFLSALALLKRNKKGRPGKYCQDVFFFFTAGRTVATAGDSRARIPAPPDGLFRIVSRMNPVPYLFSLDSLPTFCTHHPLHSRPSLHRYLHHSLPTKYTRSRNSDARARQSLLTRLCAKYLYVLLCINTCPMKLTRT